jgi:hypothetical protein
VCCGSVLALLGPGARRARRHRRGAGRRQSGSRGPEGRRRRATTRGARSDPTCARDDDEPPPRANARRASGPSAERMRTGAPSDRPARTPRRSRIEPRQYARSRARAALETEPARRAPSTGREERGREEVAVARRGSRAPPCAGASASRRRSICWPCQSRGPRARSGRAREPAIASARIDDERERGGSRAKRGRGPRGARRARA